MRIGFFTGACFPQVSGVSTSTCTLKGELGEEGHEVCILTTTDKAIKRYEDSTITRLPGVPFVPFTDRRVVCRGLISSYKIVKQYKLDITHTQIKSSTGVLGKTIAATLHIPAIHTYHTQYEDHVGYIAKGRITKPGMVKYIVRGYLNDLDGVTCPSRVVLSLSDGYDVKIPRRIIPTGTRVEEYERKDITVEDARAFRDKLGITDDRTMLLSLSHVSYEKSIQAILKQSPEVLSENKRVKLAAVDDGPYLQDLEDLVAELGIEEATTLTGMVPHDETTLCHKAGDFFVSASTNETQGLTYIESLASGTPVIAHSNPYLGDIIDQKMFGIFFYHEEDLTGVTLNAVADTPAVDERTYKEKMHAILVEHSGKSVYTFCLDVLISAKNKKKSKLSLTV